MRDLEEGSPFSIICSVIDGAEPVQISWMKGNGSISLGYGTDISTTKMYSVLQIRDVNEDHSSNYTCLAKNKAGQDSKTVALKVSCRLNIPKYFTYYSIEEQ